MQTSLPRWVLLLIFLLHSGLSAAEFGETLWEYETGGAVTSSPVLDAHGNVYFGSLDGRVYSLSHDGALRWSFDTGDWVEASPVLSGDETALYVGSWNNRFVAINALTGEALWNFETSSLVYASAAVAQDGTIYFGSSDGFLYALNPNGTLKWEAEVGGELDASPAIDANGNVFVGSSAGLIACYQPNGTEVWTWETPNEEGADERGFAMTSSPMLTSEGDVIVASQNFYIYSLDSATGALRWKYETGGVVEGSVVEGMGRSCVVGSRDGYLYSLSWDGQLNWKTLVGANYYSTPCVDGFGRIYAGALKGSSEGSLLVLSSRGELLWRNDFASFVDSSPVLDPSGRLFVGNNDGSLYAIEGGDKLASLGWSSFRGGAGQRRSLQGYEDKTGQEGDLARLAQVIDGTDRISVGYAVEGGGPVEVSIRALGPELLPVAGESPYRVVLNGSSGEMARVPALVSSASSNEGAIQGWLEPGAYSVEVENLSTDRDALFLEVKQL